MGIALIDGGRGQRSGVQGTQTTQLSLLGDLGLVNRASDLSTCTTVDSLDVDQFDGDWYQVINNAYTTQFGGGSSCTGAKYTIPSSSSRRLLGSSETAEAPPLVEVANGNWYTCNTTTQGLCDTFTAAISGSASPTNSSEPGQLSLDLKPLGLFTVSGSYWVCKTGPVVSGEYSYLIIGSSTGESLYVLARNVVDYFANFHDEVMDYISTDMAWLYSDDQY